MEAGKKYLAEIYYGSLSGFYIIDVLNTYCKDDRGQTDNFALLNINKVITHGNQPEVGPVETDVQVPISEIMVEQVLRQGGGSRLRFKYSKKRSKRRTTKRRSTKRRSTKKKSKKRKYKKTKRRRK